MYVRLHMCDNPVLRVRHPDGYAIVHTGLSHRMEGKRVLSYTGSTGTMVARQSEYGVSFPVREILRAGGRQVLPVASDAEYPGTRGVGLLGPYVSAAAVIDWDLLSRSSFPRCVSGESGSAAMVLFSVVPRSIVKLPQSCLKSVEVATKGTARHITLELRTVWPGRTSPRMRVLFFQETESVPRWYLGVGVSGAGAPSSAVHWGTTTRHKPPSPQRNAFERCPIDSPTLTQPSLNAQQAPQNEADYGWADTLSTTDACTRCAAFSPLVKRHCSGGYNGIVGEVIVGGKIEEFIHRNQYHNMSKRRAPNRPAFTQEATRINSKPDHIANIEMGNYIGNGCTCATHERIGSTTLVINLDTIATTWRL